LRCFSDSLPKSRDSSYQRAHSHSDPDGFERSFSDCFPISVGQSLFPFSVSRNRYRNCSSFGIHHQDTKAPRNHLCSSVVPSGRVHLWFLPSAGNSRSYPAPSPVSWTNACRMRRKSVPIFRVAFRLLVLGALMVKLMSGLGLLSTVDAGRILTIIIVDAKHDQVRAEVCA
jgi:hypothetical protein